MLASSQTFEGFSLQVAFGDPYWYRPKNVSPFYNSSHHQFRAGVREWVENEIMPYCHQWDEAKGIPVKELLKKSAESGWLPSILGMPWPQEYAKNPFVRTPLLWSFLRYQPPLLMQQSIGTIVYQRAAPTLAKAQLLHNRA